MTLAELQDKTNEELLKLGTSWASWRTGSYRSGWTS